MRSIRIITIAALLIAPSIGQAQGESARLGQKQKSWTPANYRTFECALGVDGTSLTGTATVAFDGSGDAGVELAVSSGEGGVPTVAVHAINTKGTGATNGRAAAQPCSAARPSLETNVAMCTLSGDDQLPTARFSIPLALFAGSASSIGTVTIVKSTSTESTVGTRLSRKGYDYYQARSDEGVALTGRDSAVEVIARCDSAALKSKAGKPTTATYDLVMAKK